MELFSDFETLTSCEDHDILANLLKANSIAYGIHQILCKVVKPLRLQEILQGIVR